MSDSSTDSEISSAGEAVEEQAALDADLAQAASQAIVRRRITPVINVVALLGLAYVTYRNGLAMNGPVSLLTGGAMLTVVVIAVFARKFRRKPLDRVHRHTGRMLRSPVAGVAFALAFVAAFFLSLTVRSYAFVAEESQPVQAFVYKCDDDSRGDPVCWGRWEVDGVDYSGLVPWSPEKPDPGDTISITVSESDPSLVTSQENIKFVRYGIYFWLGTAGIAAIFWLVITRKTTRLLREIASNPRAARASAESKPHDQTHTSSDDPNARRVPGVGMCTIDELMAVRGIADLVNETYRNSGVSPLSDGELNRVNRRFKWSRRISTTLVISAIIVFILGLLTLPVVFQADDDMFLLSLAIFGGLMLITACAILVKIAVRKKMLKDLAVELKTYREIGRLYRASTG